MHFEAYTLYGAELRYFTGKAHACLREWIEQHPNEPIPRVIGTHRFELEDSTEQPIVQPYNL